MRRPLVGLSAILLSSMLSLTPGALGDPPPKPASDVEAVGTAVLDTNAFWKVRTVRETEELVLPNGEVKHARVDGNVGGYFQKNMDVIEAPESAYKIVEVPNIRLPAETPADWMKPGYDDSAWVRLRLPVLDKSIDREWKLIQLRGMFEVADPDSAGDLTVSLTFRGGAVVYINGEEVGRGYMPQGELTPYTNADAYSPDAYFTAAGHVLFRTDRSEENKPRIDSRIRKFINLVIPPEKLKKGVNVLSVGIHRAPNLAAWYLRHNKGSYTIHDDCVWVAIGLSDIKLIAPPGSSMKANTGLIKGKGFKVWNQSIIQTTFVQDYPDPFSPVNPIKLVGVRGGNFSGQINVGDDEEITGLKVEVTDLKGPATIPASALAVRYGLPDGSWQPLAFDSLEEQPMDEVPIYKEHGGAVQPIWISVRVPRDAKDAPPGDYTGSVTVTAKGVKPVVVPMQLRLIDWALPPVSEYVSRLDIVESPESVAMAYDVDAEHMWGEKHLKLLDKTFTLLAEMGCKTLYITGVRRTHFGNEHALIRWVRGEDGELSPEFSIVEKYLDVATKHLGKVPGVILYCWEPPESQGHAGGAGGASRTYDRPALITVFDPATGKQTARQGPAWGTPEAKVFWKKMTDGIKPILAKRGLESSMLFGLVGDARPTKQAMEDICSGVTDPHWAIHSHLYCDKWPVKDGYPMGFVNALWGIGCQPADPKDGLSFGWSNKLWLSYYPREMSLGSTLVEHRTKLENWMGARTGYTPFISKGTGPRGLGRIGGDFWNVVKNEKGRPVASLAGRYPESAWGQLNLNYCISYLLGKGKNGPVATVRSEAFRESLQEVEARILLEKALFDDEAPTLLGEDLMKRCRSALDDRVRICLHAAGEGQPWFVSSDWSARSELLFTLASEVTKKMGRAPKPNLTMPPKKP